ncbi:fibrohexamerin-like [Cydia pomonella]|uniref:fibrohexamerin-like n=1 Tax=Cydia pomonella TaxID=82600 RepID=UPI002ADD53EA|nr:fibrohexamerin-like [Cydia pomonella]
MKELCVFFLVAGGLAQVPISVPGGLPVGSPCPNGQCVTNLPLLPQNVTPSMPVAGTTDPSSGGEGGTPNPTEIPLGNPAGPPNNVNRPCRRYDLQCVRYFFKDHSHCKKPLGKVPEPYLHPLSNQFFPAFNTTLTTVNGYYTGFNTGRVQDLYVNRQTDKVVVTIEFTNLTMRSRDTFLRYHRRAREPIITYGYSVIEYPSLLLTVTIPQVNDLLFKKSDNFAYANAIPNVDMDPRLGESSDPVVPNTFAFMRANLATFATEALLTQSQFISTVFIQKVICDFGIKIALA